MPLISKGHQALEDSLECTVCFQIYDDPRILACGHSFCRRCLEAVLEHKIPSKSLLECPACRCSQKVFNIGSQLPKNFALIDVVNAAQLLAKRKREHQDLPSSVHSVEMDVNSSCLQTSTISELSQRTPGKRRFASTQRLNSAEQRKGFRDLLKSWKERSRGTRDISA